MRDPYINDQDFRLYIGDALEVLREMPDGSVHCVVTSPPYWGLRDYGTGTWEGGNPNCDHINAPGAATGNKDAVTTVPYRIACGKCGARRVDQQLGLEPTPDEYVARMVDVFREVRRLLRRDGTVWLNIGSSYNSNEPGGMSGSTLTKGGKQPVSSRGIDRSLARQFKPKDMVPIPWMLGMALQKDGWFLRADIIWSKPNPMPESVTDRPTKSHEYLFLLTKSARYFYDADSIREPYDPPSKTNPRARYSGIMPSEKRGQEAEQPKATGDGTYTLGNRRALYDVSPQNETLTGESSADLRGPDGRRETMVVAGEFSEQHRNGERWPNGGRNRRSVWEIATEPYPEAHFATFPQALVEPCIKAGTSEHGCCPECGAVWERETDVSYRNDTTRSGRPAQGNHRHDETMVAKFASGVRTGKQTTTVGWRPGCDHGKEPVPCVVLDVFMGSGTTALVARRLGRHSVGIELNESYAEQCAKRLQQLSLLA